MSEGYVFDLICRASEYSVGIGVGIELQRKRRTSCVRVALERSSDDKRGRLFECPVCAMKLVLILKSSTKMSVYDASPMQGKAVNPLSPMFPFHFPSLTQKNHWLKQSQSGLDIQRGQSPVLSGIAKCPNCGTEQELDMLERLSRRFVCYSCEADISFGPLSYSLRVMLLPGFDERILSLLDPLGVELLWASDWGALQFLFASREVDLIVDASHESSETELRSMLQNVKKKPLTFRVKFGAPPANKGGNQLTIYSSIFYLPSDKEHLGPTLRTLLSR